MSNALRAWIEAQISQHQQQIQLHAGAAALARAQAEAAAEQVTIHRAAAVTLRQVLAQEPPKE